MKGRRKYSPEFREQAVNRTLNGLFDFIEVYYNRFRFHSTLGYISPEEFETNIA
ncbi:hypothetical protein U1624_10630 [Leptospira interrogans]